MYVDATTTMCTAVSASYINLPLPGEGGNGFGARRLDIQAMPLVFVS